MSSPVRQVDLYHTKLCSTVEIPCRYPLDEPELGFWLQQALAIVFVALGLCDLGVLSQPGEIINPLWTVGRVDGLTLKRAWSRAGTERVLVSFLFLILWVLIPVCSIRCAGNQIVFFTFFGNGFNFYFKPSIHWRVEINQFHQCLYLKVTSRFSRVIRGHGGVEGCGSPPGRGLLGLDWPLWDNPCDS